MKNLSAISFAIFVYFACISQVILTGCGSRPPQPLPEPPPPCNPATSCIQVRNTGSNCCVDDGYTIWKGHQYYVYNDNPTKSVFVTLQSQRFDNDLNIWKAIPGDLVVQKTIGPKGNSSNLPRCSHEVINHFCEFQVRYIVLNACFFQEDPQCMIPPVPSTPGIPPQNCYQSYQTGGKYCYKIDYNVLASTQQSALRDLRYGMIGPEANYEFDSLIIQAFSPFPIDSSCTRISERHSINFSSTGNNCKIAMELPDSVHIDSTNETYIKLWLEFKNSIDGKLNFARDIINLDYKAGNSIWITTITAPNSTQRSDIITAMHFVGSYDKTGDLILEGQNFICFAIVGIPPGG